ncbi:alpha/beta hydrolase [Williamsia sp. M5A3_1d]
MPTRTGARTRRASSLISGVVATLIVGLGAAAVPSAIAAPVSPAPAVTTSATVVGSSPGPHGVRYLRVRSAAMRADMQVRVLPARDPEVPHPTLYLLNGAQGGFNDSSWFDQTDIVDFFADKNVTVVVPMGGTASYFADWIRDDPVLGHQKWATYLTRELPPLMDATFGGNGRNALAGISMAGTSVLQLAEKNPGLYRAVGAYSGCAKTADTMGQAYVRLTVARGGGNADNLWGVSTDPRWRENDPYIHADRLRGTSLFISASTGLPGQYDTITGPGIDGDVGELVSRIGVGAVIETAVRQCTVALKSRLATLGIPATFRLPPAGTHSWPYWQDSLHASWPQFARALDD